MAEREAGGRRDAAGTGDGTAAPGGGEPASRPPRRVRGPAPQAESAELRRLRRRIDALDRRIVALLSERAHLGMQVGAAKAAGGRRSVRDLEREREVMLRVAMANHGPLRQADLLAVYRRVIAATRGLERTARQGAGATSGVFGSGDVPGRDRPAVESREGGLEPPDVPAG